MEPGEGQNTKLSNGHQMFLLQTVKESWPDLEMYADDGQHASPAGSDFAAKYIWETIRMDMVRKEMNDNVPV